MGSGFSPATQKFLERYDVVQTAFDRFHNDLESMFAQLSKRLPDGFASKSYRFANGRHLQQFSRSNWHNENGEGIHFELFVDNEELSHRHLEIGLDFSGEVPDRETVKTTLARLLDGYQRILMETFGYELRRGKSWKFLRSSLPLEDVTVDAMEEKCRVLPALASFVDESFFLVGKTPIWQADFSCRQQVSLTWGSYGVGGQHILSDVGRFGSPALRIDGTNPNAAPDQEWQHGCYSLLVDEEHEMLRNGMAHYLSLVLKSRKGGKLRVWADGHKEGSDGKLTYPRAFDVSFDVRSSGIWQCVTWQGELPSVDQLSYDFFKEGVWVVLNVDTHDTDFVIDRIEIGCCNAGEHS